jgi:hypothetical protein
MLGGVAFNSRGKMREAKREREGGYLLGTSVMGSLYKALKKDGMVPHVAFFAIWWKKKREVVLLKQCLRK